MPILTKEEAGTLLKKILSYSKAEECQVNINGSDGGNIRYARNSVSTSGAVSSLSIAVVSSFGKKSGVATINELDDASLEKVARRSEELAQLAPENPESMPLLGPQTYAEPKMYVPATAAITPKTRADIVAKSLKVSKDGNAIAAG